MPEHDIATGYSEVMITVFSVTFYSNLIPNCLYIGNKIISYILNKFLDIMNSVVVYCMVKL
jgi:hypothetical protein